MLVNKEHLLQVIKTAQDGLVCDSVVTQQSISIIRFQKVITDLDSLNAAYVKENNLYKKEVADYKRLHVNDQAEVKDYKRSRTEWIFIAIGAIIITIIEGASH